MENYSSLDNALSYLRKKGYDDDFDTENFGLYCGDLDMRLYPGEFHVDEIDRIKDNEHPNVRKVVYAISFFTGVKGFVIDESK